MGCFGLEEFLKIMEPWNSWVGRVLKDHRAMEWVELERSLKITEPWNGLSWKDLYDHRATE